eukprot:TRINITY_DN1880_c0_g2_i2.p1 TRINITY_DN1880_c0_g2~~TRINITY_DN1880_c0_g2_i2.p1  ORF type:complete len:273 (+),score=77.71 TRINITY_DN1880_c0_g2_i2:784-1602(+)
MDYQTREHAFSLYQKHLHKYLSCFNTASGHCINYEEEEEIFVIIACNTKADKDKLRDELLARKDSVIPDTEIEEILSLMSTNSANSISSNTYLYITKAMCSYLATDLNGDHVIVPSELNTLLWLTEGIEPTKERVARELAAMDINSDGSISMVEWIKYLSSIDPVSGASYFDHELKVKFDYYDADNSGSISKYELLNMLRDTFKESSKELEAGMKEIFDKCLNDMANEILKVLDKDGSEVLEWPEFKNYMIEFTKKQNEIVEVIRKAKASSY